MDVNVRAVHLEPVLHMGGSDVALSSVPSRALLDVILDHLKPLRDAGQNDSETCPLFGGVEIRIDGALCLGPQCCGDLSDIESWYAIAATDFQETYIAPAGHPSPHVRRQDSILQFTCVDEDDPFSPGTVPAFSVHRDAFLRAVPQLLDELDAR